MLAEAAQCRSREDAIPTAIPAGVLFMAHAAPPARGQGASTYIKLGAVVANEDLRAVLEEVALAKRTVVGDEIDDKLAVLVLLLLSFYYADDLLQSVLELDLTC